MEALRSISLDEVVQLLPILHLLHAPTILSSCKQEVHMTEARKTTAQYLNGLAVAVLATTGGAYLGNQVPGDTFLLAALMSVSAHALAVWIVRGR